LDQSIAKQLEKYVQKPEVGIIVRSQTVTALRPCCATKEHGKRT